MDPNETLRRLREAIAQLEELHEQGALGTGDDADVVADAAVHFRALDHWLTQRGFLPNAWAHDLI